jgi:hypothetical protein
MPFSPSTALSNSITAKQNQLVADLVAAENASEGAGRNRFTKYLTSIGLSHNIFLDSFTRSHCN